MTPRRPQYRRIAFAVTALISAASCFAPGTAAAETVYPAYSGKLLANSFWAKPVTVAPVDPNSAGIVANLAGQVSSLYGGIAALNVAKYNLKLYTVTATTKRYDLAFDNCQNKASVPSGLYSGAGHFLQVPIPAGATSSPGTDAALTIYSPATDQLWELWRAAPTAAGGWQACWGGRLDNVSTSPGYFPGNFGLSAAGVVNSAGAVMIREAQALKIDHAVGISIPNPRTSLHKSWPAQRSDGPAANTDANFPMEGQRFRLNPSVNVDALPITPLAKAIARAAQTYGLVVKDRGGAVAITAEAGDQVKATTGVDPWVAILGAKRSYNVLAGFPWSKLQALPRDYGKPVA